MKISIKKNNIDDVIKWVEDKTKTLDDKKPIWNILEKITQDNVADEFISNKNDWKPISQSYRQEKIEQGWDERVGIRTGGLLWASTEGADVTTTNDRLEWAVNLNHVNSEGEKVGDYAFRFNEIRQQFQYSKNYLKKLYKQAINKWIKGVIKD